MMLELLHKRVVPRPTPNRFYLAFDPEFDPEECKMKFRLSYDGRLEGDGSAKHKHDIRKAFHPQLKRLWEIDPNLSAIADNGIPRHVALADQYTRLGYRFVPLATTHMSLIAAIDVLFLRPDAPGSVIKSGDIDHRLKTLFDALRMPDYIAELGGYLVPEADEDPFFVLLQDDKLISHVSVETDVLLEPTPSANGKFLTNDARLIITVTLRPYMVAIGNVHFV
jgi:hypothetical protein